MENLITVSERGSLTLPKEVRDKAGIPNGGHMKVAITAEGVLLTPVAAFPIEMYDQKRLAEFAAEEAKLGRFNLK